MQHNPNDTQHTRPTDPAIDKVGSAQPDDADLLDRSDSSAKQPAVEIRPVEGIPTETKP